MLNDQVLFKGNLLAETILLRWPCPQKILMVTDGGLDFGVGGFGLSEFVSAITGAGHTVVDGAPQRRGNGDHSGLVHVHRCHDQHHAVRPGLALRHLQRGHRRRRVGGDRTIHGRRRRCVRHGRSRGPRLGDGLPHPARARHAGVVRDLRRQREPTGHGRRSGPRREVSVLRPVRPHRPAHLSGFLLERRAGQQRLDVGAVPAAAASVWRGRLPARPPARERMPRPGAGSGQLRQRRGMARADRRRCADRAAGRGHVDLRGPVPAGLSQAAGGARAASARSRRTTATRRTSGALSARPHGITTSTSISTAPVRRPTRSATRATASTSAAWRRPSI